MVKNDQSWCWGMRPVMAVDERFKQAVELDSSLTQRGSRCAFSKNAMRIRVNAMRNAHSHSRACIHTHARACECSKLMN